MIGLVSSDNGMLSDVCGKICNALDESDLVYNAKMYADLMTYTDGSKYCLVISENKKYYDVIMLTLTQEERNLIQWIGADWFPDVPMVLEE